MKTKDILLTILISGLVFFSCNDEKDFITINGRVISQITGEGLADYEVISRSFVTNGQGAFSYDTTIDKKVAITDSNGFFKIILNFSGSNPLFKFDSVDIHNYTSILRPNFSYTIEQIIDNQPLIFYARKYERLKIQIKNISPYDEEDYVSVDILQLDTNYSNSIITSIQNFGVANLPSGVPAAQDGNNPTWVGSNVDAIINGNIQEATNLIIFWRVRKNDVYSEYMSETINTLSNSITEFEINY